jgi:hypothetical protein
LWQRENVNVGCLFDHDHTKLTNEDEISITPIAKYLINQNAAL